MDNIIPHYVNLGILKFPDIVKLQSCLFFFDIFNDFRLSNLTVLLDFNECERKTHSCHPLAKCSNERGSYSCKCRTGYLGIGFDCRYPFRRSCSEIKKHISSVSKYYMIDPDGDGGLARFTVYCDMTDKKGVGVTVISHGSESRTYVRGDEDRGSYKRDIQYNGASLSQLASLTRVSSHCEQFIKYECYHSGFWFDNPYGWWVSRDSSKMTYWGGASPSSDKCAWGMNNSCTAKKRCNCDANDQVWREDSGFLTDKTKLPVKQLRFGGTGRRVYNEKSCHTLGKFKCYGAA